MNDLSGKSIIITGAGSGIGKAAAQLLGDAGCFVTVADINENDGKKVVGAIEASGRGGAQFIHTDVTEEASVKAMVASAERTYGKLYGAINSAGVPQNGVPLSIPSIVVSDSRPSWTVPRRRRVSAADSFQVPTMG